MITLVILGALLACLYAYTWSRERRACRLLKGLPSWPCLPFVGNFYQFLGGYKVVFRKINELFDMAEKHDKPVLVWAGSHPIVILCDPEDVKLATNTFIERPYFYDFAKPLLGEGIFSAPAHIWKRNIKKIVGSGSFSNSAVQSYQEKFNECGFKLAEQLKQQAGGGGFDAMETIVMATLDAICQTVLGSEFSADPDFIRKYHNAQSRFFDLTTVRSRNIFLHPDFVFHRTRMHKEVMESVAVVHEATKAVMTQRNQKREEMKRTDQFMDGKPGEKSFYEKMLELHETDPTFTMEQVQSEIHTVIIGGQKTVATTINFVFMILGHYPDIQKELYEELKEVFGDSKRPVTSADLERMPYCEAVISETLRLYPPGPLLLRSADSDLKLKHCTIPNGATIALGVWNLHRCKRVWGSDARQFRPERWLEPDCPGNTTSFAAFSCGKRACIGKRYAMAILKTMIALCARELEFEFDLTKLELKLDIILKVADNYCIQLRKRE